VDYSNETNGNSPMGQHERALFHEMQDELLEAIRIQKGGQFNQDDPHVREILDELCEPIELVKEGD
jgi:hypothetical protein